VERFGRRSAPVLVRDWAIRAIMKLRAASETGGYGGALQKEGHSIGGTDANAAVRSVVNSCFPTPVGKPNSQKSGIGCSGLPFKSIEPVHPSAYLGYRSGPYRERQKYR
jgi:hypothetical protein